MGEIADNFVVCEEKSPEKGLKMSPEEEEELWVRLTEVEK